MTWLSEGAIDIRITSWEGGGSGGYGFVIEMTPVYKCRLCHYHLLHCQMKIKDLGLVIIDLLHELQSLYGAWPNMKRILPSGYVGSLKELFLDLLVFLVKFSPLFCATLLFESRCSRESCRKGYRLESICLRLFSPMNHMVYLSINAIEYGDSWHWARSLSTKSSYEVSYRTMLLSLGS